MQIPAELEKHFVVLDHDLPGRDQLEQIARGIATEDGDLPQGDDLNMVLDAAAGLTRFEAEGAYSLSIVRHGNIRPDAIWELKSQTLKKSGLLQLYRGGERFDGLGGLQSLKSFCSPSDATPGPSRSAAATTRGFAARGSRALASLLSQRPLDQKRAGRR